MADIKCKYTRWRCYDGTYEHGGQICEHHDAFGNGHEYDESCEYGDCEPYLTESGMYAIPLQCRHVQEETVMFEKNVKSWSLDNDEFTMRGLDINVANIKELVIDGKVIIEEAEDEQAD